MTSPLQWRPPGGATAAIAAWSLACALVGGLLLVAEVRWLTPEVISGSVGHASWAARSRAWFASRGFQGAEVNVETGDQFSWTSGRARVTVPNLSRSIPYRLWIDVSAIRGPGVALPTVSMSADGGAATTIHTAPDPQRVSITLPPRGSTGLIVTIESSDTFVPGGGDSRVLGVVVHEVGLEPLGAPFRPSLVVTTLAALAIGLMVAGVSCCRGPRALVAGLSAAIVLAVAWLLLLDAAFLGRDVWRLVWIGAGVFAMGALTAIAHARWPVVAGLPGWATAASIVLALGALKLAFFTHPQIALTDAGFQVHRAMAVHRGEYFFTSVTPAPSFEFPYAILLYLAALPFWSWFSGTLELANLLRGLSLVADALVGVALYAVVRRAWNHEPTALLCAALWVMTRAPAMALGHANLTNLFGQGLFGIAMAGIAWMAVCGRASAPMLAATGVVLTAAFLSHFSTLSTGILLVTAVALACIVAGNRDLRRVGVRTATVLAASIAASYALYYSHFNELYVRTFTRIASGADHASTTSMVASPALKLQRWITEDQFSNDYGLPGVALFVSAVLGLAWLWRERRHDGLTIVLVAWGLVWVAVSALGILTSVELRANLAATPMFVCLAAYGLAGLGKRSTFGRMVAATGVAAVAWAGLYVWLHWLVWV